jgi:hypothetical protein
MSGASILWYSWIQKNMFQNGGWVTIDRIKRAETHPVYPAYPVQKNIAVNHEKCGAYTCPRYKMECGPPPLLDRVESERSVSLDCQRFGIEGNSDSKFLSGSHHNLSSLYERKTVQPED